MGVHVAQINVGTMVAATDDPAVAEFMDALEHVNTIADAAPGFVWRLQTDSGNATEIQIFPDPLTLVNMSVWESVDALKAYVYRSEHMEFFRRRAEWFEPDAKRVALWHVPQERFRNSTRRSAGSSSSNATVPVPTRSASPSRRHRSCSKRRRPTTPIPRELIERLNHELAVVATHPGENHFALAGDEVTGDRGRMVRRPLRRAAGRLWAVRDIGDGAARSSACSSIRVLAARRSVPRPRPARTTRRRLGLRSSSSRRAPSNRPRSGSTKGSVRAVRRWGEYVDSPETSLCFSKSLAA